MNKIIILILTVMSSYGYQFTKDLTLGSKGTEVVKLQEALIKEGHLVIPRGVPKGYFGKLTQMALASYQAANGIAPASGFFGPKTRAHLNAKLTPKKKLDRSILIGRPMLALRKFDAGFNPRAVKFHKDLNPLTLDQDVCSLKMFLFCRNILIRRNTNGFFDKATSEALKEYQRLEFLPTTGVLDKRTREHINKKHPLDLLWYMRMKDVVSYKPRTSGVLFLLKSLHYV